MTLTTLSEAFTKLNPAQKQAAETIEGPVQVIAGPGTGKTQILASRIAQILSKTDIDPWNILCLTFTEAGVVAMRKRLISFIGPTAHKVQIHTFHSLCNSIIQENQQFFGTSRLTALDDIEMEGVMNSICESIEPETPLFNNFDAYSYKYALTSAFGTFKKEYWTADIIKAKVEKVIKDLREDENMLYKRNGKGFQKGDFKEKEFQKEKKKLDKITQAADLFDLYNSTLDKQQRYDYDDMILWVLKGFNEFPELLMQYQELFQYVLTDEFQDTNGSQFELIKQLMGHWDSPNIFSVGDDDQSIYAFQGANVKNMLEFGDTFKKGLNEFVLTVNYRSTPEILASASALIKNNTLRLVNERPHLTKNLTAVHDSGNKPAIIECHNPLEEASWIAQAIEEKIAAGIPSNDIAVLYNKHKYCNYLMRILQAKNIPLNLHKSDNILNNSVVEFLIRVLNYVQKEMEMPFSADHELFLILHAPFFKINSLLLAEKAYELRGQKGKDRFWRIAAQKEKENLFASAPIKNAMMLIEGWISFAINHSPIRLMDKLMQEAQIFELFEKPGKNNEDISAINSLFMFVKDRNEKNNTYNLKVCIDELNLLLNSKGINVVNSIKTEQGVNFVTIHSSKGLEFKHVFVLANTKENWDRITGDNISLRPLFGDMDESIAAEEEKRRLLYVAITRAEKNLYLTYFNENDAGKPSSESGFITELKTGSTVDLQKANVAAEILEQNSILLLKNQSVKLILPDIDHIKKYLEGYTLSATHLNRYISCPVAFYYENLLRVPSAKSEAACIGTSVHKALHEYFKEFAIVNVLPDVSFLLKTFENSLRNQVIYFNDATFEHKLENAKIYLTAYYENNKNIWAAEKNFKTEKSFSAMVGNVPIYGVMDKVLMNGNDMQVIDYKTGNPANAVKKMKAPDWGYEGDDVDKKFGGPYWRQMMFYHFLVERNNEKSYTMQSAAVSCVEKDKTTNNTVPDLKLFPDAQGLALLETLIKDTYANIMAGKFDEGCNKVGHTHNDCVWCTFQSKMG